MLVRHLRLRALLVYDDNEDTMFSRVVTAQAMISTGFDIRIRHVANSLSATSRSQLCLSFEHEQRR